MKTLLSQFCHEFGSAIEPLVAPLRSFCDVLQAAEDGGVLGADAKPYVAGFQDVSHQLTVLADKVAQQQAYVLIFGPLKSGKSTLMNSISASYVSEVTALPAYPCMVYVSHAPQREFVVTRYNGDTNTFTSPASMRMQVSRDHAELADRIRAEESKGEGAVRDFDPALHFPEAIRRIDVRVPAEELKTSGAVLVDTPGLYSKMKFGYDRMTREFRNTAACAIFVVKTDNLFLEQVFDEFSQLLQLFSRIFLVVNIDSAKMDLRPDGSLSPSLEREDPVRVIEAFETLAMSASLKEAVEHGRLKIYPIDLLRAASRRLQPEENGEQTPDDFRAFLNDLTDYLNSTDYLVAFLGDSLRHGGALIDEARGLCNHTGLKRLADDAARLKAERARLVDELTVLEHLIDHDWNAAFEPLGRTLADQVDAEAARLRKSSLKGLRGSIEGWMGTDDGLKTLLDEELSPILLGYQTQLATAVEERLRAAVQTPTAGAEYGPDVERELERVRTSLAAYAGEGLVGIMPRGYAENVQLRVDVEGLPVKKTILDWILFRSRAAIRRRVLGNASNPTKSITRAEKQRRFGDDTLDFIEDEVVERLAGFFDSTRARITTQMARDFAGAVIAALEQSLRTRRTAHQKDLARVAGQLGRLEELSEGLTGLRSTLAAAAQDVAALGETYGRTDPTELATTVESELLGVKELSPQPPRALPDQKVSDPTSSPFGLNPEIEFEESDVNRGGSNGDRSAREGDA
ncbi:Dynamin family protein [Planctomycetes bacterium Pla163]|uniref:Dynamin family protein n=1 Tax=Rohdeia mirabilis TaxID=2528008 RepID=A0A518D3L4_9BACT|nr:Dynamin family protein [Planctomycetes bacterium Pla163]